MVFVFKLSFWVSLLFSCRMQDPEISNKIIDSVEMQESHGNIFVKNNGECVGLMQINSHYVSVPASALRIPAVNRVVGIRAIKYWKKRANGNIKLALASYNCGNAGLQGKCGIGYANAVMGRNISKPRRRLPQCMLISRYINAYLDGMDYVKNNYSKRLSSLLKSKHRQHRLRKKHRS